MANDDDLPSEFDLIVLGTGMPESILAAAASRVGQTVLHIDRNEYYGGNWASFNFDQLLVWVTKQTSEITKSTGSDAFSQLLSEGETFVPNAYQKTIFNLTTNSYISDKNEEVKDIDDAKSISSSASVAQEAEEKCGEVLVEGEAQSNLENEVVDPNVDEVAGKISHNETSASALKDKKKVWTMEELSLQRRKFNIDLSPKLLFSRGPLVELLISSNIARYAEFKSATRVLTFLGDEVVQVPCSRADVFSTKHVTVVEKRMLMKFIAFCLDFQKHPDEYRGFEGKPFKEFVKSRKLTPNVEHYIINAIAMVDPDTPTLQSLTRVQKFLESLGRYGNSPFLWPIYGSAELPQCFCRLCAVFGGIYYLNRLVEGIIVNIDGKCSGIVTMGKRINCKWLVMEPGFAPLNYLPDDSHRISKGIFITDKSIMPAEREQLTLLRLPPEETIKNAVTILEVGAGACVCPPGLNIIYASCLSAHETAELDMSPVSDKLFTKYEGNDTTDPLNQKPKVLWSLYFNQLDLSSQDLSKTPNVFVVPTPDIEQDYENAIEQAKLIFAKINPEEEFLPRAPDPEEIILESDEPNPNPGSTEEAAEALEDSVETAEKEEEDPKKNEITQEDDKEIIQEHDKEIIQEHDKEKETEMQESKNVETEPVKENLELTPESH